MNNKQIYKNYESIRLGETKKQSSIVYLFLGLVTTAVLWYKNESQHKIMVKRLENQINEERTERIRVDNLKDSIYKILIEKQTIEKILNKK